MNPDLVDARATVCQVCFLAAVCEIRSDGGWEIRCPHCGTEQLGLPGYPPPPSDGDGAIALAFAL